jgi:hypothetical protein
MAEKKETQDEQAHSKYKMYLLDNEKIEKVYDVGFYDLPFNIMIATNSRLIIITKFPKNFVEVEYHDVEVVEYYTNVEWLMSLYSAIFVILGVAFFLNRMVVIEKLGLFFPPAEPILMAGNFFGMNVGSVVVVIGMLAGFGYFGSLFGASLFGKLRLLFHEQAPVEIITPFSPRIQEIIKHIETKKRESEENKKGEVVNINI